MTNAWVDRLERWLTPRYAGAGVNVTVNNGAVPGALLLLLLPPPEAASDCFARGSLKSAAPLTRGAKPGKRETRRKTRAPRGAGTTSAFMCACFRRHVPDDADVVFIEYAVNDDEHKAPAFNNNARCGGVFCSMLALEGRARLA